MTRPSLRTAPLLSAVTTYNVSITAIFGSGNPNGGWVSNTDNGIQLGLRAKGRNDTSYVNTTPNDGSGHVYFPRCWKAFEVRLTTNFRSIRRREWDEFAEHLRFLSLG